MLWLDATQGLTLLADEGARFADAQAQAAWARRVWAHYGSEEPAHGAQQPWAAPWRSRARCAASVTTADVAGWQAAAAGAGRPLAGVAPLWAGALALALQRLPALERQGRVLVSEGPALTVIDIAGGEIRRWELSWLAQADAAALAPWAAAASAGPVLALGHSLPGTPPASLRVPQPLDRAPAEFVDGLPRVTAPSFVPPQPLEARWAWAFAATAALVLGVAAWDAADAWQARAAAHEALIAFGTRSARAVERQATPRAGAAARPAAADDAARLAAPWAARFVLAESAVPAGGHWLRLEQPQGDAPLRLAGTVATPGGAFELAQRIAAAPGVADVAVLRSEVGAAGSAGTASGAPAEGRTRFELSVVLAPEGVR